jgi:hypothetical protein
MRLSLTKRLGQLAAAFDHVDDVVDNAVFKAHQDVEVAQANVGVNHGHAVAQAGQAGANVGR